MRQEHREVGALGAVLEGFLPPQATRKVLFSCQCLCP